MKAKIFNQKNLITLLLAGALLVVALSRGVNMFNYPAYREDEGTYVSQAWAVLKLGELAPYTYWYDHVPGGWILMAAWHAIAGFFTFDMSVNSGRAFMLLVQIVSAFLVFRIVSKISGNKLVGIMAVLLYALTPLGIAAQRRVFLDNIMTFWLLVAINFLAEKPLTLTKSLASAVAFGLAFLSKETAVLFLPAFAFFSFLGAHRNNRHFSLALWSSTALLMMFLYPLMALLKEELLPTGTFLGGDHPHVSLYEAIMFQTSRGGDSFFDPQGSFVQFFREEWWRVDKAFIVIGSIASIINLTAIKKRRVLLITSVTIFYALYLASGTLVLDWYIIPLIPLLVINIALLFGRISNFFQSRAAPAEWHLLILLIIFFPIVLQFKKADYLYNSNESANQVAAITWIRENLPESSIIVIDNYAFLDLRSPPQGLPRYSNAHYYWKVDQDPEVRDELLKNDWRNVDYIIYNRAVEKTINEENMQFIKDIYNNSTLVKHFDEPAGLGPPYGIQIREVQSESKYLRFTWDWYKNNFITGEGRVVDLQTNNRTTSEGQSYAMMRALWNNDKETFDKVWNWTKNNLKKDNGLFSWLYEDVGGVGQIVDPASASDGDEDIAFALLQANKRWNEEAYAQEALSLIKSIWDNETVDMAGKRILVAGDWVRQGDENYIINPSYFAPYAYRMFGDIDKDHNWQSLIDSSYEVLNMCSVQEGGNFFPTDWCVFNSQGERLATNGDIGVNDDTYSFDAIRSLWRLSLDYAWFTEERALNYLRKLNFWQEAWREDKILFAQYSSSGQPITGNESLSHYANQLAFLKIIEPQLADEIYNQKIKPAYKSLDRRYFWGDRDNYYDQNWVWFGLAFYTDNLQNFWY